MRSESCGFMFSVFLGQLFISHETIFFLHKLSHGGAFEFGLCFPFLQTYESAFTIKIFVAEIFGCYKEDN